MAYQLLVNNLGGGASQRVIPLLAALQKFAALTPPVTTESMRVAMELDQLIPAGQPRTYTDAEWLAFLTSLASIEFTQGLLTAAELTVFNVIRLEVNPSNSLNFCTESGATPANGDGLTDIEGHPYFGDVVTFKHEIRLYLDKLLTCDIKQVEILLTPQGGAPAVTSANPFLVNFNRGSDDGLKSLYSFFWATFGANPSGFSYQVALNHLDADGGTVASYTAAYTLNI